MRRARFARPVGRIQRKASPHPSEVAGALQSGAVAEHAFEPSGFEPDFSVPDFEQNWSGASLPNWALAPTGGGAPKPIQAALEVKEPGDPLEEEADRVADDVLGDSAPGSLFARMERRFDDDLGDVRLHRDGNADALAESMSARAFTTGNDIYFREHEFRPETPGGQHLIAHELTHVVQQRRGLQSVDGGAAGPSATPAQGVVQREPDPTAKRRDFCYESSKLAPPLTDACDPRTPEKCPTYEGWLASFSGLKTFEARDTAPGGQEESGFDVLGVRATRPVDKKTVPEAEQPPPPVAPLVSDRFIDHPTDLWVRTCLPDNLRETAYRLRSDCADIAVILRHVWLSAHHRTEVFGGWTCGAKAGDAQADNMSGVIDEVFSGNAAAMVNAYSDSAGKPLQEFEKLKDLLHPGDVLVWAHHDAGLGTARTGGHVMTIASVTRKSGKVLSIEVVQGNQPIFSRQADEIRAYIGKGAPESKDLRGAPGRRIEASTLSSSNLRDLQLPQVKGASTKSVWTWSDGHTTLVAAGPPRAATRPAMQPAAKGAKAERRITDWVPSLKSANKDSLQPTLEAALLELRAVIEGGATVPDDQSAQLATAAGERLFGFAKAAHDLADESHFEPLFELKAVIAALGEPRVPKSGSDKSKGAPERTPRAAEVKRVFELMNDAFERAARGATSVSFGRAGAAGKDPVNVLVTGFDPFEREGVLPAKGTINPSAAAALELDGTVVKNGNVAAAVEGVVLPVDFKAFEKGLVESIAKPLLASRGVDAILTVSLDPNLSTAEPVRLERFVVGVHERNIKGKGTIEAIPASPGGSPGPAIIETPVPLESVARDTEQKASKTENAIQRPTIGTDVTFRFESPRKAKKALEALGLPAQNAGSRDVTLSDPAALRKIVGTMMRMSDGRDIEFRAGGQSFRATVVEGPGGNFLSNEASFRMLRLLAETGRSDVASFHTHVPPGASDKIPQDTSTPAARTKRAAAVKEAMGNRATLLATLRRMIGVVAAQIAARRKPKK
jgi:pyrrolidone-carboxylate peptidase